MGALIDSPTRAANPPTALLEGRVPLFLFVATFVFYAGAVFSLRYFPTLDGPMLLYYADAFQSLVRGEPAFHSYYTLEKTFGSHLFYFYFVTALAPLIDLITIEKIFLLVYLAWLAFSFYYLADSIAPGNGFPAALFVFPFALNANVYWAFYDFSIGVATALFVCGWWLQNFLRLNVRRSAIAALLLIVTISMHLIAAAMVLLFAGVHLVMHLCISLRLQDGASRRDAVQAIHGALKPGVHLVFGALLLYAFKPASVGKALTTAFWEEPRERLYQVAVMRPFGAFESRYHRALLGIVLLSALLLLLAALLRKRSALVRQSGWAASVVVGLLSMAAFVAVPFWMAGGAFFPHRFAAFGCFFLLAPAAILRLSPGAKTAVAALVTAVSLAALVYQVQTGRTVIDRYGAVLDLPPARDAALAAIIAVDEFSDPALNYHAQLWTGAHYVRRSGAALLNSPWLDVPGNWFQVRRPQPCQYLQPILMRDCLRAATELPGAPPLDLLVGVRARPFVGPAPPEIAADLALRYGLTKVWSSQFMAVYKRPEANASAADGATSPGRR